MIDYHDNANALHPTLDELFLAAAVEHEYFHCRHILSSSIGYLLFYLSQIIYSELTNVIRSLPMVGLAPEFRISGIRAWMDYLLRQKDTGNASRLSSVFETTCLLEFLSSNTNTWELLKIAESAAGGNRRVNILRNQELDFVPVLTNVDPPGGLNGVELENCPTLVQILEGLALWKEYAFISLLAGHHFPRHFTDFTRKWLNTSFGSEQYRRVVDMILYATGCNMSMALPGVLIDIALCGPYFSCRPRAWSEVHPSLRFMNVLRAAEKIPNHLKRPDNLNFVGEDYYRDVEQYVSTSLGWSSVETNINDTVSAVLARNRLSMSQRFGQLDLGRIHDRLFLLGLGARKPFLSTMLFPWCNPASTEIGYLTQPPATKFQDEIRTSTALDSPMERLHYLLDTAVSIHLDHQVNHNHHSPLVFRRSRDFFRMIPTAFRKGEVPGSLLGSYRDYDAFISEVFGYDYADACTSW